MAKIPTFDTILTALFEEASNRPMPRLYFYGEGTEPIPMRNSRAMIPGLRALVDTELREARDAEYHFDPHVHPFDHLTRNPRTHPTVQRWLRGIEQAAEEERFND